MSIKPKNNIKQLLLWLAMREMRDFRLDQIQRKAACTYEQASRYLCALRQQGYVEEVAAAPKRVRDDGRGRTRGIFRLVRDTGPQAPRLGKEGLVDPNLHPSAIDPLTRTWQIMRMMGGSCWTALEIAEQAELTHPQVKNYIRKFLRCGYLRKQGYLSGGSVTFALYKLVRNSGPLCPVFRQDGTAFDPNTGAEWPPS